MLKNRPLHVALIGALAASLAGAATLPNPSVDEKAPASKTQTAVFAGGCFWGIEAVFDTLKGVNAVSGYSGGAKNTAHYDIVSTGTTGHAESVQVTYDPSQVSYGQLLQVFFSVHDPTELNRQGPDEGTQYRSAIFYANDDQKKIAEAYIQQLTAAKTVHGPMVTKLTRFQGFYPAVDYHLDDLKHNPRQPYIVVNDQPKVAKVQREFPQLLKGAK